MIVEDELAILSSLIDLMELAGYSVRSAGDGKKGLGQISNKVPDLIISDVMMPEMDGYQFLKEIRSNARTRLVPFIFLTAKVELESKLFGMELGADGYINKPFEFRELDLKVRNLLVTRERYLQDSLSRPAVVEERSQDTVFLKKLNLAIEEQIEDTNLSTEEVAAQLNMSLSTFSRRLKKLTGKAPNQFMKEFRLTKAKDMIAVNYGTLSEIASKTGFSTLSYFSHSYKEHFGKNPSEGPQ